MNSVVSTDDENVNAAVNSRVWVMKTVINCVGFSFDDRATNGRKTKLLTQTTSFSVRLISTDNLIKFLIYFLN